MVAYIIFVISSGVEFGHTGQGVDARHQYLRGWNIPLFFTADTVC